MADERHDPSPAALPGEVLVERARDGDVEALDALLRRVHPQLDSRARSSLGSWLAGRTGASDILQDALVEVLRGIGAFRGTTEAEFVVWVQRIVDRTALMDNRGRRAAKRREPSRVSGLRDLARVLERPEPTPSTVLRDAECVAAFEQALSSLTLDQRLAFEQVMLERRPIHEVAADLHRSVDALHALLGRARARLVIRLSQLGALDG